MSIGFFASGLFLLSRLVRSASPHAFFAVAMAVYLGQVIVLLLVIIAFKDADWVDGTALGVVALVVTIVWQVRRDDRAATGPRRRSTTSRPPTRRRPDEQRCRPATLPSRRPARVG